MNVYIEYAIANNLLLDLLIIKLTVAGKSVKSSIKKRFLSALFGTAFAVYLPILKISELNLIIAKISVGIIMVLLAGEYKTFKMFIMRCGLFFLLSFAFGGCIYGICGLLGLSYDMLNAFSEEGFLAVALFIALIIYVVLQKLAKTLYQRKITSTFICKCVINNNGKSLETDAFIDSGNGLIFNGYEGVCVADFNLFHKLQNQGVLPTKEIGKIPFKTATGRSYMKIYEIEKLQIFVCNKQSTIYKAKIGIPNQINVFDDRYSLILPAECALK